VEKMTENDKPEMVLKKMIKALIKEQTVKVKGKFLPISEKHDYGRKILTVKKIYSFTNEKLANFYLIEAKNYLKGQKMRYFIAISLAGQSSDLLVMLARKCVLNDDSLRLIQYPFNVKNYRLSLLCLKEIRPDMSMMNSFDLLKDIRKNFRTRLHSFNDLINNE
jgi:hypothetical protein